jgi:hypothetical protein
MCFRPPVTACFSDTELNKIKHLLLIIFALTRGAREGTPHPSLPRLRGKGLIMAA